MKKIFTLIALVVTMTMNVFATEYTDTLNATVYGIEMDPQVTTISVTEQTDGKYTVSLKNVKFDGMSSIGTIVATNVEGTTSADGVTTALSFQGDANVVAGDDETVTWGMAGETLYITMAAEIYSDGKMYATYSFFASGMSFEIVFGTQQGGATGPVSTDYTDTLVITVGEGVMTQTSTITVTEQTDGKYTFTLKNLSIEGFGGIGTISVENLEGTTAYGITTLNYSGNVTITKGDDETISSWLMAGQSVPVTLTAEIYGDGTMYANIDINYMNVLTVNVKFGTQKTITSTDYTDTITTTVGGSTKYGPETATITVSKQPNGNYALELKNFSITGIGGVGTILIDDIIGIVGENTTTYLSYNGNVTIKAGDDEKIEEWLMAGYTVPVTVSAEIYSDSAMYATIYIDNPYMTTVNVEFGTPKTTYVAVTYTDTLEVLLNGTSLGTQNATVTMTPESEEVGGSYNFELKNLIINTIGGVGTITISGLTPAETSGAYPIIDYTGTASITEGDASVSVQWQYAGQTIPVKFYAEIYSAEKMYATITPTVAIGGTTVQLIFGTKQTDSVEDAIINNSSTIEAIYDINGIRLNSLQKGINIVRKSDGTTTKVYKNY